MKREMNTPLSVEPTLNTTPAHNRLRPAGERAPAAGRLAAVARLRSVWRRLQGVWRQKGAVGTLRFLLSRVGRRHIHLVYEFLLTGPVPPVQWVGDERLLRVGSAELAAISPELLTFLGGDAAAESIEGLRTGDHLFVVADKKEYLHRGYIFYNARHSKMLGDVHGPPVIGCCATVAAARGRGLYRKALHAELAYLKEMGYNRVLIAVEPDNSPSRRGIEGAGFSLLWEAHTWVILNCLVIHRLRQGVAARWLVRRV